MTKEEMLDAIRKVAKELRRPPSRAEFRSRTRLSEYRILEHFRNWREAVRAAGFEPDTSNVKLGNDALLCDWARVVRDRRAIPTRNQYRRDGQFSVGVFEKHFGPWSRIPDTFREFAGEKSEYADVIALLPVNSGGEQRRDLHRPEDLSRDATCADPRVRSRHSKLDDRPTYGNPLDFRGLRHEPVNEQGVVFLFGIVARELGYMVEAVQAGFPDCEAKRQVDRGKWQRVRIEFEFESRHFRDHGHAADGCDLIVCWRHNWPDCPRSLEVVELSTVIRSLSKSPE